MSASSRRSTSKSRKPIIVPSEAIIVQSKAIIERLKNFYDTYYDAHGNRNKDDANSFLIIKKEEPPIPLETLDDLFVPLSHESKYSTLRKYISIYGAAHYPKKYGSIGSNTTYSPASTKKGVKGGKRGKRVYTRKTYKNKK